MGNRTFNKNDVIFRQGEEGKSFFQILNGCVGIMYDFGKPDEHLLAELKKDQFFGEMAVIEGYPRSATAVALEDGTEVLEIASGEIDSYLSDDPEKAFLVMQHLSDRLRTLTKDYEEVKQLSEEAKPLAAEGRKKLFNKAQRHIFFYKGNQKSVDALLKEAGKESPAGSHSEGAANEVKSFPKGTVICREGEVGDCMYDIHQGSVGIYTGYQTDKEQQLTVLYPNTFFGEAGMISNEPRSATAVALEDDTAVEIIRQADLKDLFKTNPSKAGMIMTHLSNRLRKLTGQYIDACKQVYEDFFGVTD